MIGRVTEPWWKTPANPRRSRWRRGVRHRCADEHVLVPKTGEKVSLLTHMVVREDAQLLYGFGSERGTRHVSPAAQGQWRGAEGGVVGLVWVERGGSGPRGGDAGIGRLTKVPGIGKKTAERLLLELKGKAPCRCASRWVEAQNQHRQRRIFSMRCWHSVTATRKHWLPSSNCQRDCGGRWDSPGLETPLEKLMSSKQDLLAKMDIKAFFVEAHDESLATVHRHAHSCGDGCAGLENVRVMKLGLLNRNAVGTHFGGALFAMVDPFCMIPMMQIAGPRIPGVGQGRAHRIHCPGRGTVYADIHFTDEQIAEAKAKRPTARSLSPPIQ